jgi:hypothetical protein
VGVWDSGIDVIVVSPTVHWRMSLLSVIVGSAQLLV